MQSDEQMMLMKAAALRVPKNGATAKRLFRYKMNGLSRSWRPLREQNTAFVDSVMKIMHDPRRKLGFGDALKGRFKAYQASATPFKDALYDIFIKGPGETLLKGIQNPASVFSSRETANGLNAAHPYLLPEDAAKIMRNTQVNQALSGAAGLLGISGILGANALFGDNN